MTRSMRPLSLALVAVWLILSSGAALAQVCSGWQKAQPMAGPGSLAAATWGDGQFWVFGNSAAFASPTGFGWTSVGAGPGIELMQVRWAGGSFTALGRYGVVATSPDGARWTRVGGLYGPPSTALNDVAWNGAAYVAVGFNPTESGGAYGYPLVLVSSDLAKWEAVSPPPGGSQREELDGIVWTGSRFVAVGLAFDGGIVMTSEDGRAWTRIKGPGGSSVAWNGSELVAVGGTVQTSQGLFPAIWRSRDGLAWDSFPFAPTYSLRAVTWDGSRFVAVGQTGGSSPQALIITSADGVYWGGTNEATTSSVLVAVAAQSGTTVAVGSDGAVLTDSCAVRVPLYVPAAAHLSGLNGSLWRTDLEVHNPGSAPIAYTVDILARDADNSAPASRTYTLGSWQSVRHLDALASLFGFTGAATLRVTPLGGQLMTNARVYTDAPSGSYGQFVEGQPDTGTIAFGMTGRMIHLSQAADRSAGFRTNLGVVSASPASMTVVADLFRADATQLGEVTVTLRPYESVQRTEVFREFTGDAVGDGYIVVKTTTDGGRFFAYASVIDNRSNDPVYMAAR